MSDASTVGPISVESKSPVDKQAAESHVPKHPVLERLYAEPQRFELFQAVRLLFAEAVEEAASVGAPAPPIPHQPRSRRLTWPAMHRCQMTCRPWRAIQKAPRSKRKR
jgi:hypothetical protein